MRYVKTRYIEDQRELAYRIYLTDSLQNISKGGGEFMTKRYYDLYKEIGKPSQRESAEDMLTRFKRNGIIK